MRDLASKILSRQQSNADKTARKTDPTKPKITTGKVLKYMFLPDIGSRIRDIGKRFGNFAYFLAQIFYSCRLIPPGHPVLNPANIGYFGFSDVISTAAANLQLRKENTDQIVMFAGVIISMVLLIANGLAIAAYTVFDFGDALAETAGATVGNTPPTAAASGSMFVAPHPKTDLALKFLDMVFGASNVPFFAHEGKVGGTEFGSPALKEALYTMLGLYSTAMMVIAVIIVLYYAFTIVGESAMTGQPFGKRFNSFWAPIRLVVGLGLLVPLGGGLNAAQYTTLYAAKLGSGLASYAWSGFVTKLATTNLVAPPIAPDISGIVAAVIRFEACAAVANRYGGGTVEMVEEKVGGSGAQSTQSGTIVRWDKKTNKSASEKFLSMDINDGYSWLADRASDLAGLVGMDGASEMLNDFSGSLYANVPAACGEIFVPADLNRISYNQNTTVKGQASVLNGINTQYIHDRNLIMIRDVAKNARGLLQKVADAGDNFEGKPGENIEDGVFNELMNYSGSKISQANGYYKNTIKTFYNDYKSEEKGIQSGISNFDDRGWMGAGMFYTQIADLNGGLMNIISSSTPRVTGDVVIVPSKDKLDQDALRAKDERIFSGETDKRMRSILQNVDNAITQGPNPELAGVHNYRQDFWTSLLVDLFGGNYLKSFRESSGTNPLADMMALGHGMMTKGMNYITYIIGALAGSALLSVVPVSIPLLGALTGLIGGALSTIASVLIFASTIGVALGVLLFYVVPLIPFIYFFFAVVSWITDLIEAMIGLPLWALAHIRIDGDGLSGQAAQLGYNAIFGVIIRPVVILFALVISVILYSAGMVMVKEMYGFYVNSIGNGESNAIDYVAFSGIYAVISFTLATLCFKQIDQMPQQIMRWFGVSDPRYNDGQQDPVSTLQTASTGFAYVATQGGQQLGGAVKEMGQGAAGGYKGAQGLAQQKQGVKDARAQRVQDLQREWAAAPEGSQQREIIKGQLENLKAVAPVTIVTPTPAGGGGGGGTP